MNALDETRSIEAEIAECCRELYFATEAAVAMSMWERMRTLMRRKNQAETELYLREAVRDGTITQRP